MTSQPLSSRLLALGAAIVIAALASLTGTADAAKLSVRKNVADLTSAERLAYVTAVRELKTMASPYTPGISYYDQFVEWHKELYRCPGVGQEPTIRGHGGPMFLPWHRRYVLLFEAALRKVGGKGLTVPYWDWTDRASTDAVFSDEMMGGDGDPDEGYAVKTGPFRKGQWELTVMPEDRMFGSSATPYLTRKLAQPPAATLPTTADVEFALSRPRYDASPWDTTVDPAAGFRNALEGFWREIPGAARMADPGPSRVVCTDDGWMTPVGPGGGSKLHNGVHLWVGGVLETSTEGTQLFGTMVLPTSPNDPTFFLHHSNIDRLWSQWQARTTDNGYRPTGQTGEALSRNNLHDELHLLGGTPADMEDITALGYRYAGSGAATRSVRRGQRSRSRPRAPLCRIGRAAV